MSVVSLDDPLSRSVACAVGVCCAIRVSLYPFSARIVRGVFRGRARVLYLCSHGRDSQVLHAPTSEADAVGDGLCHLHALCFTFCVLYPVMLL